MTENGRRRGRPKADPLDYLKTKVWCAMLARHLGVNSAYAVAERVDGNLDRVRTWQRHFKGETRALPRNGMDDVRRAEACFPGTERFYTSGIWHVLRGGRLTLDECHWEIVRQSPEIGFEHYIARAPSVLPGMSPRPGLHVFANARTESEIVELVKTCPTYDGLQALILLIALAESAQNRLLRNMLCITYREMLPAFIERQAVPFHEEVFDRVDLISRFRNRRKGFATEIEEVPASWRMASEDSETEPGFDLSVRAVPTPRYDKPWRRSR